MAFIWVLMVGWKMSDLRRLSYRCRNSEIPAVAATGGVTVVEQPNNGGYIHGPSINHAVAAAVLRNAYLTHADESNADHFAVRLTSERVRTALSFLGRCA